MNWGMYCQCFSSYKHLTEAHSLLNSGLKTLRLEALHRPPPTPLPCPPPPPSSHLAPFLPLSHCSLKLLSLSFFPLNTTLTELVHKLMPLDLHYTNAHLQRLLS